MDTQPQNQGQGSPEFQLEAKGERRDLDLTAPMDDYGEDDISLPPGSSKR